MKPILIKSGSRVIAVTRPLALFTRGSGESTVLQLLYEIPTNKPGWNGWELKEASFRWPFRVTVHPRIEGQIDEHTLVF